MAVTVARLSLYSSDICCCLPPISHTSYPLFINLSIVSLAGGQFSIVRVLRGTHPAQE